MHFIAFVIFRFSIVAIELSLTAIPVLALLTLILFKTKNDFSPTDRPLSPQLDKLRFINLYSPYDKSRQSFNEDEISKLLIVNLEKSISKPSLREFLISILFIFPSTLIKFTASSQLDLFAVIETLLNFKLIEKKWGLKKTPQKQSRTLLMKLSESLGKI